jgi:hypothetical protein
LNENLNSDTNVILQLNKVIQEGKLSEIIVIDYTNTLITAMNPRTIIVENEVPNPHPCSLDYNLIPSNEKNSYYESLCNCCQRHVCKPESGYCKKGPECECRFGYPFELCEASHLEFEESENNVKAKIFLKRNDSYMNMHNRLICENWAANVDMQIILDQAAAISYMVKYATKAEKTGNSLNDLFKSVVLYANEDDVPTTKLRLLMIKSVSGKRDLGQCEVCRLLMSGPLYSSTFEYITQSLELNQSKELNNLNNRDNTQATNKSLIDFFAHRLDNPQINQNLEEISSFYQFVKYYKVLLKTINFKEQFQTNYYRYVS